MTDSVIQHIKNEQQPYRIPIFKIKSSNIHFTDTLEKKAKTVRLTTCDFVSNFYNIGYNSNCLRWLRIVETSDNIYYKTKDTNFIDIHLCKLYITPGAYSSVEELINEINSKLYYSFFNLFDIGVVQVEKYINQHITYPLNDEDQPKVTPYRNDGVIVLSDMEVKNPVMYYNKVPSDFNDYKTTYIINGYANFVSDNKTIILRSGSVTFTNMNKNVGLTDPFLLSNVKLTNPYILPTSEDYTGFSITRDKIISDGILSLDPDDKNQLINVINSATISNWEINNCTCEITDSEGTLYNVTKLNECRIKSIYEYFNFDDDTEIEIEINKINCTNFTEGEEQGDFTPFTVKFAIIEGTIGNKPYSFTYDVRDSTNPDYITGNNDFIVYVWKYYAVPDMPNNIFNITFDDGPLKAKIMRHNAGLPSGWYNTNNYKVASTLDICLGKTFDVQCTCSNQRLFVDPPENPSKILASDYSYREGREMIFYKECRITNIIPEYLTLTSGTIASSSIDYTPKTSDNFPETLFNIDWSTKTNITTRDVRKNANLLKDPFYYEIANTILTKGIESQFVNILTDTFSNKVYLQWAFDIIPVTSNNIYSNTENFLSIVQDPNFQSKYTTICMPKVVTQSGENFGLTGDNFELINYTRQDGLVDNYYYNFAISKNDVWDKLGYNPALYEHSIKNLVDFKVSDNPDGADIEKEVNPTYFIKGVYYSECNYHGTITLQHKTKIEQNTSYSANITQLPEGYDIWSLYANTDKESTTIFNTYFYKKFHLADRLMNFSIPKTIEIKITQNEDVEEFLNTNEIVDSVATIGQFDIVRDNNPMISSIQQEMVINQTIEIPPNDELYVFLTNGDQNYSLMDSSSTLNVEYIN